MYVVGSEAPGGTFTSRIEKRRLSDGALCSAANCGTQFGTNGVVLGGGNPYALKAVVIDGTYLYAAGQANNGGLSWQYQKRNLSDGALVSGFGSGGVIE